jgi:hypothetical protein
VHARRAAQISAPNFPIRALRALKGQTANVRAYREVLGRKEVLRLSYPNFRVIACRRAAQRRNRGLPRTGSASTAKACDYARGVHLQVERRSGVWRPTQTRRREGN